MLKYFLKKVCLTNKHKFHASYLPTIQTLSELTISPLTLSVHVMSVPLRSFCIEATLAVVVVTAFESNEVQSPWCQNTCLMLISEQTLALQFCWWSVYSVFRCRIIILYILELSTLKNVSVLFF